MKVSGKFMLRILCQISNFGSAFRKNVWFLQLFSTNRHFVTLPMLSGHFRERENRDAHSRLAHSRLVAARLADKPATFQATLAEQRQAKPFCFLN